MSTRLKETLYKVLFSGNIWEIYQTITLIHILREFMTNSQSYCQKYQRSILVISLWQKQYFKNIWRKVVHQNSIYKSTPNILQIYALFQSYFQKYAKYRQHLSKISPAMNGLNVVTRFLIHKHYWQFLVEIQTTVNQYSQKIWEIPRTYESHAHLKVLE